jgi:hypothetical protein
MKRLFCITILSATFFIGCKGKDDIKGTVTSSTDAVVNNTKESNKVYKSFAVAANPGPI